MEIANRVNVTIQNLKYIQFGHIVYFMFSSDFKSFKSLDKEIFQLF